MLTTPADGEWLTWRRSHDNLGFSPLTQITKQNVGRPASRLELGAAERPERGSRRSSTTA